MGITTQIEWCDSTLNAMMGCGGCELWIPKAGVRDCYAGVLTERYAGLRGWPEAFDRPRHFPDRLEAALRWPDLTSTARPGKPWLDGMPRLIFLDDMGDTFTESLDPDWLLPYIPRLAASPHVWIFLTKRARRMVAFWKRVGDIPPNVWPGTTITGPATLGRLSEMLELRDIGTHDNVLWCSFEPLMGPVNTDWTYWQYDKDGSRDYWDIKPLIDWAVVGGGSHMTRKMQAGWAFELIDQLVAAAIPVFFKQFGDLSVNPDPRDMTARENGGYAKGGRMIYGRTLDGFPKGWGKAC